MKKLKKLILLLLLSIPSFVLAARYPPSEEIYRALPLTEGKLTITDYKTVSPGLLYPYSNTLEGTIPGKSFALTEYLSRNQSVIQTYKEWFHQLPMVYSSCSSANNNCKVYGMLDIADLPDDGVDIEVDMQIEERYDKVVYNNIKSVFANYKINEDLNLNQPRTYNIYDNHFLYYLYNTYLYNQSKKLNEQGNLDSYDSNIINTFLPVKELKEVIERYNLEVRLPYGYEEIDNYDSYFESYYTPIVNYNGTGYLISNIILKYYPIILIPDDSENPIEAATEKIQTMLKPIKNQLSIENVTSSISASDAEDHEDTVDDFLSTVLGTSTNKDIIYLSVKAGNTVIYSPIKVVQIPKDKIPKETLTSYESTTGIILSTENNNIPIDSKLRINDVTVEFTKKNNSVLQAFDIVLYSKIDAQNITKDDNGFKIYIPINSDFEITGKKIAYLDEKGKAQELYDIKKETIDGQDYITFVTKHLSVYAIVDKDGNPNTVDRVGLILIIGVVVFIILFIIKLVRPRKYQL